MDKVTETTLARVIFNSVFNRAGFGSPKLNFTGRLPAEEIAAAIREMRKARTPSKNAGVTTPFTKEIHIAQMKYIARDLFIWCFEATSPNGVILKRIGHTKLNKTRFEKLNKKVRAPFARDVIHSFYNRKHKPNWWLLFRTCSAWCMTVDDEAKYCQRLAASFKDAMPPEGSGATLEVRYRTTDVMSIIKRVRETEDFSIMQILADALQDAGYDRADLLAHYRDPLAVITLGSWIFRATGLLETTRAGTHEKSTEVPNE